MPTMPEPEDALTPDRSAVSAGTGLGPPQQRPVRIVLALFVAAILLLPLAFLMTLRQIESRQMRLGAEEIARIVTGIRSYYATNVVERLQASGGQAVLSERYKEVHGGIPIPATLSIELGALIDHSNPQNRIAYRFVSDYPFPQRRAERPTLDAFQTEALQAFRRGQDSVFARENGSWMGQASYRLATPVVMQAGCVACHNAHPESPRRDWKLGDVRGIQEVEVSTVEAVTLADFRYLGVYMAFVLVISVYSVGLYRRQAEAVRRSNVDLAASRERERQASQQLREKVDELILLGAVVDGSTFGVTIADARQPDYPLVYANPAFYAMTGLAPEQVMGHNCRFLKGPETDPAVSAALGAAVREGRPYTTELLNYRADGQSFWNRLTLFPVGGSPGRPNHFVGYQIDITAVRAAQAEREQMMAEIQESQKLESLGVLVAGVAHEVNNPLGIALTAATHMAQSAQDILAELKAHRLVHEDLEAFLEDERVAFDLIVGNLKRAADLVRSFKDVAADQAHEHRREVRAVQFLSTLTTSLAPIVKRARCQLDLDVEGDFPMVVDTGAFAQLVTNLVVNATVHAFDRTDTAATRRIELKARQVPDSADIELSVQDNGVGIPAGLAERIFEPFFTTRRGQGGTGLGLFVVHRIVTQNLQGSIRLEAVQPQGVRFVIRFPGQLEQETRA